VKLYEKSNVKIDFLKEQKQKLNLNNVSLYDNDYQSHKLSSDYFVFRAFKKLHEILRISRETITGPHKLIVMMGKSAQDQLNKASKADINKYKLVPSITSKDSKILLLDA
jgi:Predicted S-adenosylmethionine-dependent methyltransferase involved in bacterial cell division